MKLTLKSQAAVMATVISVMVVSLFGWSQREPIRREMMAQIKAQQTALVKESAEDLRQRLDTYLGVLERTAQQLRTVRFESPAREAAFYQSILPVSGLFDGVFLASADGKVTAISPRREGVVGIDIADRDYFKQVMLAGQPTLSGPLRNRVGGEPIIILAAPVHDQDGNLVGLIGASLYLLKPNFLGNLRDMRVGQTGHVYLITRGEHPIYIVHPDRAKTFAPLDADPAVAAAFGADPSALPERGGDVVTTHDIIAAGWRLGAVLPGAEANRQLFIMRQRFRWSLLALAALVGVSVWGAMLWLLRPLGRLHAAMTQLSTTDLRNAPPLELQGASAEIDAVSTAFHKLMGEVARQRAELQTVTDALPALVSFIDTDERFRFLNAAYEKAYGRSTASMLGQTVREVAGGDAYSIMHEALLRALAGETVIFEREHRGRDQYRCEEISYLPQFNAQGQVSGVHSVALDITERKKQELRLRALTTTDHLTGLANRAGFEERLLAALDQVRLGDTIGALLLLDLDSFKVVNDTYGHAVGDALLRTFGQRLARAVRPYDGVARFGGDEFAVILEHLSHPDDAKTVAANVLSACNRPFRLREATVHVGASIGIAIFDYRTLAQNVVFEAADEALYEAKSRGKGLFVSADELPAA